MRATAFACTVGTNRSLARAGLEGGVVTLRLDRETLTISESGGEAILVAAAQVERMRLARFEPAARTHGFCEAEIRWPGPPLYFSATIRDDRFARVIGGFARGVAAARGIGALRRGPDLLSAIAMMMLTIGSLTLLLALLLYVALADGGWWWAPLALFVPLYLLALRGQLRNHWPRRLEAIADLESLLPRQVETRR